MYVKSLMKKEAVYRKSVGDVVLKPLTVTFVDESIVSAEELLGCYGDRISIIPENLVNSSKEDKVSFSEEVDEVVERLSKTEEIKRLAKSLEENTEEEEIKVEDVQELIDILKKLVAEKRPTVEIEGKELTPEETIAELDDLLKDFEGEENNNIPEIKDFLDGKTDNLPEGTEVITNNEANKLESSNKVVKKQVKKSGKGKKNK